MDEVWEVGLRLEANNSPVFFESNFGKGKYIFCLGNPYHSLDAGRKKDLDYLWTDIGETAYILESALSL